MKVFFIFRETEIPKNLLLFQVTELTYISGNEDPKKVLKLQEETFWTLKIKKTTLKIFLILQEMEPSCHNLKNVLYFGRKLEKSEKQTLFFCSMAFVAKIEIKINTIEQKNTDFTLTDLLQVETFMILIYLISIKN